MSCLWLKGRWNQQINLPFLNLLTRPTITSVFGGRGPKITECSPPKPQVICWKWKNDPQAMFCFNWKFYNFNFAVLFLKFKANETFFFKSHIFSLGLGTSPWGAQMDKTAPCLPANPRPRLFVKQIQNFPGLWDGPQNKREQLERGIEMVRHGPCAGQSLETWSVQMVLSLPPKHLPSYPEACVYASWRAF